LKNTLAKNVLILRVTQTYLFILANTLCKHAKFVVVVPRTRALTAKTVRNCGLREECGTGDGMESHLILHQRQRDSLVSHVFSLRLTIVRQIAAEEEVASHSLRLQALCSLICNF
jgi:hypothetical protein